MLSFAQQALNYWHYRRKGRSVADRLKGAVAAPAWSCATATASASPDLLERLMGVFSHSFRTSVGVVEVQGDGRCWSNRTPPCTA